MASRLKILKFQPFESFEELTQSFQDVYFPSVLIDKRSLTKNWRKERTFALRFNEYYRAIPGLEAFGYLIPINLVIGLAFAVLAIVSSLWSFLVLGGGILLLYAAILPSSRRVIPTIPHQFVPFLSFMLFIFFPFFVIRPSFLIFGILADYSIGEALTDVYLKRPSMKGSLCYGLLVLEASAKRDEWGLVKRLPEFFSFCIKRLDTMLDKFFHLGITNMSEIEVSFNRRLLLETTEFQKQLHFFDDPALQQFLTQKIGLFARIGAEKWQDATMKEVRVAEKEQNQLRFEEIYKYVDDLIHKFEGLSCPFKIGRLTLFQRLGNNAGKIIAILSAILSGVLGIMELFLYSEWLFLLA